MTDEQIRIQREELFDPEVDKALARERIGRERIVADTAPVSPIRRLLLNSMFYLPVAAVLGALVSWWWFEPHIHDRPVIGGEVMLVNAEPFDAPPGFIALTVGSNEVLVDPARVQLVPGAHGEPALASVDELKVGARIDVACSSGHRRLFATVIRPTDNAGSHSTLEQAE
jgi:hypothetical protein